jgi:DNA-binding CsgD family transcriptional regulator
MRSYLSQSLERIPRAAGEREGISQPPCVAKADLFRDLYNVTDVPRCWQRFLTGICNLYGASCGVIARHAPDRETDQLLAFYTHSERSDDREPDRDRPVRRDYGAALPILFPGAVERLMTAPLLSTSADSLGSSSLFGKLEIKHLLVARVNEGRDAISYVAIGREAHHPAFDLADEELMAATLLPHLQQAMHLARLIEGSSIDGRVSATMLDLIPIGVLILDERGACITMNDAARKSLDDEGVVLRQIAGQLPKRAGGKGVSLHPNEPAIFTLSKPGRDQPLVAIVRGMGPHSPDRNYCIAFVIDGARTHDAGIALKTLEGLYGLTTTEARVAALIAKNFSAAQIAETLGTTLHTIRTHLRHIFEKTGTERQIDLVHLLLRILAALQTPPEPSEDC